MFGGPSAQRGELRVAGERDALAFAEEVERHHIRVTLELTEGFEPSLEAQFRALEAASVDDALAELKQRAALQAPRKPRALASA